jgi:hypothetical protein
MFPNVAEPLMNKVDLTRYNLNELTNLKEITPEYRMFETSKPDMMFWFFSRITADRAKVNTFYLIEEDLRNYFATKVDAANYDREWNATFYDYIPESSKEVVVFNVFSNAIDHVWVDKKSNKKII